MKNFFSIILIFVILYMFYFPVAYLKYARAEDEEFSELLLSKAVDYAGEAAIAACLENEDIELDYSYADYMVISPERAAYIFASALCLSYGFPQTDYNLDSIVNKIPAMVFAVYDGYYIAEERETGNGEAALRWGLKRPYLVDTDINNPNAGTLYGVELGMRTVSIVNKSTLSVTKHDTYAGLPFDKEIMLQHINREINRDVNEVLKRYAVNNNKPNIQSFYLPVSAGTAGVRRIERPSLIIVMQDMDIEGIRAADLSVISGMTAAEKRVIVGWTDGAGRKYYCRQDTAVDSAQLWIQQNGKFFDSTEDAAREGYLPYG